MDKSGVRYVGYFSSGVDYGVPVVDIDLEESLETWNIRLNYDKGERRQNERRK